MKVNVIVTNEALDVLINIRLLIYAANKIIILKFSKVSTSDAIIN